MRCARGRQLGFDPMKPTSKVACAVLLLAAAAPAVALQLGQIQVKSALNQPLVAAIPLHPKNLTELNGLSVGLAPASDFARAGLQLTPTDQTLRFRVITDNNGQRLILVTSSQPVTDPYLDFLIQVNTRQGKQVREFVVLLNPVIAAPAPEVQAAPTMAPPVSTMQQPAQLPAPSQFPQPSAQPAPPAQPEAQATSPMPPPAPLPPQPLPSTPAPQQARPSSRSALPSASITVHRGDTLYGIASDATRGSDITTNQLMLALKNANPDAFFKDNINDLKTGAILRIPTRNEVDRISVAQANTEVHRQYEAWRAARPHPATVLAGTAEQAAANAAPKPGNAAPASDHLSLVRPVGKGGGTNNRPGVAGGTGSETVAGLRRKLQDDRDALVSLNQSNKDLASRVQSLEDIAGKTGKLLSLKDATVAELQHKLAQVRTGVQDNVAAGNASAGSSAAAAATRAGKVAAASRNAAVKPATSAVAAGAAVAKNAAAPARTVPQPWYQRPVAWIIAGLVVLALILIGLFSHRRRGGSPVRGPLPDPEDVSTAAGETPVPVSEYVDTLHARLAENPQDLEAHLRLCRWYYARGDAQGFVEAAQAMHEEVTDPDGAEWREVQVMGDELAPQQPLFAESAGDAGEDPYGLAALQQHSGSVSDAPAGEPTDNEAPASIGEGTGAHPDVAMPVETQPASVPEAVGEKPTLAPVDTAATASTFSDDPVDTKLDLARAYLDMGDPTGARTMLEEVLEEGSQMQKDEARRLLVEAGAAN